MAPEELRAWLLGVGLSQAELARLVGASARSVSSWTADAGSVPGPVEAYTRLFSLVPGNVRQLELQRLKGEKFIMRDGIYFVKYGASGSQGWVMLTFDRGAAYGVDLAGGSYDGVYLFDAEHGLAEVKMQVTIPANVPVVWGPAKPYEWAFPLTAIIDPHVDHGQLRFTSPVAPDLEVSYHFLRPLPPRSPSGVPFLPVPRAASS